ncbi:MAG TPA: S-methyl-5-thioribose-1-phosphate isomerase [Planctomycetaceae bacterium]|jgi:methylthioribose-1-phosphate isomerase|nr:S-methyl-5-thioribose-1-phosphate isomerase [Planctomycetaceae bacterium]
MPETTQITPTLAWIGDVGGCLRIIDQTLLPGELRQIDLGTPDQVWEAISALRVRGAPAIGVAAAYGLLTGLKTVLGAERPAFDRRLHEVADYLESSRPTAVNLAWALRRMQDVAAAQLELPSAQMAARLLEEARRIETEDREMCAAIGRAGADLLADGSGVLTHCNAGSLATAGDGTALAVIYAAVRQGKRLHVFVDETRPLLQGARLTAWELTERGIPATLLCDSAAGWIMQEGRIQAVVTGADRIAANGDTANKIGTYSVAHLARAHGIPFYVAAPTSTFDLSAPDGRSIPIEERAATEVTHPFERQTAPTAIDARNPAFDVTPAELITALITERGLIQPVTREGIRQALGKSEERSRSLIGT